MREGYYIALLKVATMPMMTATWEGSRQWAVDAMFVESYMNVSQYSLNKRMEREAIGSIDELPSVKESLHEGRAPGESDPRQVDEFCHEGVAETDGGLFRYGIDEAGRAHIVRCLRDDAAAKVPEAIEGHHVRIIDDHAFSTCYQLARIVLPDTVEEVRDHAFMNTALKCFDAPRDLRAVGEKAFYRCVQLERVGLGKRLEKIGDGAFLESGLHRIDVPSGVSFIGRNAFKGTHIVFSGGNVTLHISDENERYGLHEGALYKATSTGLVLCQVLDEEIAEYHGVNGLTRVADNAFHGLKALRCASLPEGTLAIGEAAFRGCSSLTSVEFPDSLQAIGRRAFWGTALESLRIPVGLCAVGAAAFYTGDTVARNFKPTIRTVEVAEGNERFFIEENVLCQRLDDGAVALLHFGAGNRIVVPRSVTRIGPYAYMNNESVTSITIHDRLENIDVGGLDFGKNLYQVICEVGGERPTRYVIDFPPNTAGNQTARIAVGRGKFDVAYAYAECDRAILHTHDLFTRARMMIDRLKNPICLSGPRAATFKSDLALKVPGIVVEFGRNGYLVGIDDLLDLGILSDENVQKAVDATIAAGEVAASSRLMELQRTQFGLPLFDFDL